MNSINAELKTQTELDLLYKEGYVVKSFWGETDIPSGKTYSLSQMERNVFLIERICKVFHAVLAYIRNDENAYMLWVDAWETKKFKLCKVETTCPELPTEVWKIIVESFENKIQPVQLTQVSKGFRTALIGDSGTIPLDDALIRNAFATNDYPIIARAFYEGYNLQPFCHNAINSGAECQILTNKIFFVQLRESAVQLANYMRPALEHLSKCKKSSWDKYIGFDKRFLDKLKKQKYKDDFADMLLIAERVKRIPIENTRDDLLWLSGIDIRLFCPIFQNVIVIANPGITLNDVIFLFKQLEGLFSLPEGNFLDRAFSLLDFVRALLANSQKVIQTGGEGPDASTHPDTLLLMKVKGISETALKNRVVVDAPPSALRLIKQIPLRRKR